MLDTSSGGLLITKYIFSQKQNATPGETRQIAGW